MIIVLYHVTTMAKISHWSDLEVECSLNIWADENIQNQLDKAHKNSIYVVSVVVEFETYFS